MATLGVRSGQQPLAGVIEPGGDKSLSHRALLLSAIADGPTRLVNLSTCDDVQATKNCLRMLGVPIDEDGDAIVVEGRGIDGLAGPTVTLSCDDSGTTMRLLAGLLAGQDRAFTLTAGSSLAGRPMERVIRPLRDMGADIRTLGDGGRPPIAGRGGPLTGIHYALPVASAQVGSAILLAGLRAAGHTSVVYPSPVRDHSERMLAAMGAQITWDGRVTHLAGPIRQLGPLGDGEASIPNDPSSAAFLACAAALRPGSRVILPSLCLNPGRGGFYETLQRMGGGIETGDWRQVNGEPVADLTVSHRRLKAVDVLGPDVPAMIDELPLIAVLATQAEGRTTVRGAEELRVKESDRIAAIVDGLRRLGASIQALDDGFIVDGPTPLAGAELDGRGDHRIVMALGVAALVAEGESRIGGAERTVDSYPNFIQDLNTCGANLAVVD